MILKGKRIWLRKYNYKDIPTLYNWRNTFAFRAYCSTRRNEVSLDEFRKEIFKDFKKDRHLQCIILRAGTEIGTIYAYNLNRTDGYVYVPTFIDPKYEKSGYGAEAFSIFTYYLFRSLQLFKVYSEVYSYNTHSLSCFNQPEFVEEG